MATAISGVRFRFSLEIWPTISQRPGLPPADTGDVSTCSPCIDCTAQPPPALEKAHEQHLHDPVQQLTYTILSQRRWAVDPSGLEHGSTWELWMPTCIGVKKPQATPVQLSTSTPSVGEEVLATETTTADFHSLCPRSFWGHGSEKKKVFLFPKGMIGMIVEKWDQYNFLNMYQHQLIHVVSFFIIFHICSTFSQYVDQKLDHFSMVCSNS